MSAHCMHLCKPAKRTSRCAQTGTSKRTPVGGKHMQTMLSQKQTPHYGYRCVKHCAKWSKLPWKHSSKRKGATTIFIMPLFNDDLPPPSPPK
eukprot:422755-Amphidinium_carterae.1